MEKGRRPSGKMPVPVGDKRLRIQIRKPVPKRPPVFTDEDLKEIPAVGSNPDKDKKEKPS